MEKRAFKRIPISLEAELMLGYISYAAIVEDISECGLNMIITPMKNEIDFAPKAKLELKLHITSGETLHLNCRGIWSSKFSPYGLTKKMGMEIIDPPTKYKELLNSLQ